MTIGDSAAPSLVSTATLMRRLQDGDDAARAALLERCVPLLRRWARGRLPDAVRGPADTDDLIQTTVLKTLDRLDHLEPRESGSLLAYMRQVLLNAVRDELRRYGRRPRHAPLGDATGEISEVAEPLRDPTVVAAYERALADLSPALRDAVVLRVEFGMTFPEIAAELELASANAARMRVSRALAELAERMPR
jgi:RNA polymerase sigma-70 factor (ECF subfamily)